MKSKGLYTIVAVVVVLAVFNGRALATPNRGGDCTRCHSISTEAFDLVDYDGMADPAGGVGLLKYYDVSPGDSVDLVADVHTAVQFKYGLSIDTSSALPLTQGAGSTWTGYSQYYATDLKSSLGTWPFNLDVDGGQAGGWYAFIIELGGKGFWGEKESFYVHVVESIPGDTDLDGDVDGTDLANLGLNWSPIPAGKVWAQGDFDGDGDVDGTDLAAVGINWDPAGATVPEPISLSVLMLGAVVMIRRRRRSSHSTSRQRL